MKQVGSKVKNKPDSKRRNQYADGRKDHDRASLLAQVFKVNVDGAGKKQKV
ncbi:hypothetical protein D3C86_1250580 [compost metagenome]